ncbi:MAG: PqqD family protein [Bacteroidaceae bacterium]|nr:PqqD family protein [Bacteroidaceae bacterium]
MQIKPGFELRNICGENIIIAHGVQNIDFSKVITLNESAATVWNAVVGKTFTEQDIVNVLTDEYEVDLMTAQDDANVLVASWKDAGLIE